MKEAIRRLIYAFAWLGLASPEIVCESGTFKFRFYNWLYDGEAEPVFATQWPDDDEPR